MIPNHLTIVLRLARCKDVHSPRARVSVYTTQLILTFPRFIMTSEANKVYNVGVILFDGVDILDFAAPVGVLSDIKYKNGPSLSKPAFKIHHVAAEIRKYSVGAAKTTVIPDTTFAQARQKLWMDPLDILVIPGGPPGVVHRLATGNGPEVHFIRAFIDEPHDTEDKERIALSICDGSLFLAAVGTLSGLCATSHHTTLGDMERLDPSIEVVDSTANGRARRYVDGGLNHAGVRMITAGGVTCGLDASLYVAELKVGIEAAEDWAKMNEYEWRRAR